MVQDTKPVLVELRVFSTNFKLARLAAGLTQADIDKATGLGRPYLSNLERLVANVGIDSMASLSHAVKVPLYRLLEYSFNKTYDLSSQDAWLEYRKLISNGNGTPFERRIFAQNLKQSRTSYGLTQVQVADLIKLDVTRVIALEQGTSSTSIDKAVKLAHLFGTSLSILLKP